MSKADYFTLFELGDWVAKLNASFRSFGLGIFAWCKHGFFWLPSTPYDPTTHHVILGSEGFTEAFKARGYSTDRKYDSAPPVLGLFLSSSPFAIACKIALVHINAFQTEVFRSVSHIGKKVLKLFPFLTHCNSAATVEFVIAPFRIIAPLQHVSPRSIRFTFCETMCNGFGFTVTPTGSSVATTQRPLPNSSGISTITEADAINFSMRKSYFFNNYELVKYLACKQNSFWHIITCLMLCNWRKLRNSVASAESFYSSTGLACNTFHT